MIFQSISNKLTRLNTISNDEKNILLMHPTIISTISTIINNIWFAVASCCSIYLEGLNLRCWQQLSIRKRWCLDLVQSQSIVSTPGRAELVHTRTGSVTISISYDMNQEMKLPSTRHQHQLPLNQCCGAVVLWLPKSRMSELYRTQLFRVPTTTTAAATLLWARRDSNTNNSVQSWVNKILLVSSIIIICIC